MLLGECASFSLRSNRKTVICILLGQVFVLLAVSTLFATEQVSSIDSSRIKMPYADKILIDETLPEGKGAVLVPELTGGINEPVWILRDQAGKKMGEYLTGKKVPLDPGSYLIVVGSGAGSQLTRIPIDIHLGRTLTITPRWGALVVHIVDENETPYRGAYELFEFSRRESLGIGRGAEEEQGEKVKTWLLKPSIYKLVGPTETFRSIQNFTTVRIRINEVNHLVIVVDRSKGRFLGAGVVPAENFSVKGAISGEVARSILDRLKIKFVVGGNIDQNATNNNVTAGSNSIGVGLFSSLGLNYLKNQHFWNFLVDVEGGIRKSDEDSFVRKVKDEFSLNTIYILRITPFWGPYVRFSGTTQFTTTYRYFDAPRTVGFSDSARKPEEVENKFALPEGAFDPIFLEEGLGFNLKLLKRRLLDMDARIGVGLRHTLTSDGFYIEKDKSNTEDIFEFKKIANDTDVGVELILIPTARLTRFVSYSGEYNAFYGGKGTGRYKMDNIFVIHLTRSFSFGVLVGINYDQTLSDEPEFSQALLGKFTQSFF